jgi:hypothetical protein
MQEDRMHAALRALLDAPQNNLTVRLNGCVVFGGAGQYGSAPQVRLSLPPPRCGTSHPLPSTELLKRGRRRAMSGCCVLLWTGWLQRACLPDSASSCLCEC